MKLKKILASVLALCMVLSTMSFNVFAKETTAVAKVGDTYYDTLTEAMGKFNGRTVEVLCDVEEDIYGFWGVTLVTNVEGGVTITDTYTEDWIDFDDVTVGAGVTVKINLPFSGDSENVILGTLAAGETYYHGYDAKTTIKDGGKVTVSGTTILRYNETADAGLYIYGDGDDSTVEFDCDYYIGAYSGTFYAENANIEAGYYLLKNSYDNETYADVDLILDNSSIKVVGTTDGQDSFIIDDKASVTLKNGSAIEDVRDFNILAGANLDLSVDASSTIAATNVSVAEDVNLDITQNEDGTVNFVKILKGDGSESNPYLIRELEDLKLFCDNVNNGTSYSGQHIKLTDNIDLNNEEWTPIGNSTYSFQGIFDGDNHTISNLLITGNNSNAGLFGVTTNGEIKNLTVENASVSGRLNVGVVAGTPYTSKYTNITVKGHVEVNGMSYVGGVGGKNAYANWTNITVDVDDTSYVKAVSTENGTAYRTYVGGVIGFMGEGSHTVENVTSNIDVIGDVCDVGGIVGIAHYGNNFKNVKCSGSVTNTNTNLEDAAETGGIAGVWHNQQGQKVTFENCEYIGDSNVALVGAAYNANDTTEKNSGSLVIDGNTSWPSEARIGMTGYESFEEAVAEAKDGDIVTLVNDAELDTPITIKNNITIDGNGHKITQSAECNNNIALLYFEGSADNVLNVTVKNATFDGLKVGAAIRTLYANMDIDNCVFQNCEHTVGQGLVRLTYGTANITNTKFLNNNCSMGISFNWDGAGLATDTLTVDNCEFTGNTANKTALIYYVKGAGCEIKNSKFVDNDVNTANNCAVIYLGFQENCSVTGCLFEDNTVVDSSTSTRVAGAIFFGYEAEISGNAFINNTASNANGDALGQICTSTYYECEINLSENYFGGQAPVEGKDYYIQHKTGDGEFVLNNYYESYTTDSEGNIVLDGRVDVNKVVATNGENYYYSLQDAIDVANAGDVIVLSGDVSETVTVNAPAATYSMRSSASGITIDLNNFTLTGNITVNSGATATIKNGTIINDDSSVSAVQTFGTTTLENVDVTSARHAVRVEGGVTTINGGSYKVGTPGMTTHAVNVSDGGKVVINDGVFEGPAGVADSDSGAAVNVQANSTVEIYGGKFSGGKINTLAGDGTFVVYEGMFDQDVAAYIAETSEAIDRGAYEYPYGVAPKAAGKINVALEATDNKNVYNIVITSADKYDINEFVSAELTFKNESTTVGGSVMDYKINGYADNKTFAQEAKDAVGLKDNEEQYIISLNDGAKRLSSTDAKDGDGIIIGQVEFFGQGDIKFSVTKGEVDTTWQNTNLGRYYTTEVVAPATEATLGIENASINSNVPEVHRDVAVNVAFNHNIDTEKYWGNYQITATIKNSAMNYTETKDITIKDIKSGACVFEDVPVGYITVTLKAPGFRTYTYNTTLEETKNNGVLVLNFWNDVKKGNDEAIEKGKDKMAHNFLVGDIVMDMKVDKYDLAAVTSYYGTYGIDKAEAEKYIKYDLNRDGDIDIRDVQYVLHTMGN